VLKGELRKDGRVKRGRISRGHKSREKIQVSVNVQEFSRLVISREEKKEGRKKGGGKKFRNLKRSRRENLKRLEEERP